MSREVEGVLLLVDPVASGTAIADGTETQTSDPTQ